MADATGEDRDSKQGNLKEENDFFLEETAKVLTLGTGEPSIANKIVGYVQDYFRLDSLERIQESSCTGEICTEWKMLLDANVADETYVQTVLDILCNLIGEPHFPNPQTQSASIRKLVQNDGMKLVVQSMNMHPNYKPMTKSESGRILEPVTTKALAILIRLASVRELVGYVVVVAAPWLERDEMDAIYSFLVSDFCMTTVIDAMWNVDAKWKRGGEVDGNLATVSIGMKLLAYIIDFVARHDAMTAPSPLELYAKILQQLEQKNVLPLCWHLLKKHIRWDSLEDPTSDENSSSKNDIVAHACFILTQYAGGAHRPILKKLLVLTPQEMIDEILARVTEVEERGHTYDDDALEEFRMECHLARSLRQVDAQLLERIFSLDGP